MCIIKRAHFICFRISTQEDELTRILLEQHDLVQQLQEQDLSEDQRQAILSSNPFSDIVPDLAIDLKREFTETHHSPLNEAR